MVLPEPAIVRVRAVAPLLSRRPPVRIADAVLFTVSVRLPPLCVSTPLNVRFWLPAIVLLALSVTALASARLLASA